MSRLQLALNLPDLGTEPANLCPGSANFAIASAPLKLVLMEDASASGCGTGGARSHPGVFAAVVGGQLESSACC